MPFYTTSVLPLVSLNLSLFALVSHYPALLSTPVFGVFHIWFLFCSTLAFQLCLPVCYSSSTYFRPCK
jgi:Na+/melibiose symporter-like transporter